MNDIQQLVREEMARHILKEHKDSGGGVMEEGLGSDLFRATTGIVSGTEKLEESVKKDWREGKNS